MTDATNDNIKEITYLWWGALGAYSVKIKECFAFLTHENMRFMVFIRIALTLTTKVFFIGN